MTIQRNGMSKEKSDFLGGEEIKKLPERKWYGWIEVEAEWFNEKYGYVATYIEPYELTTA